MARLVAPDKGVRGADVTTDSGSAKYDVQRDGTIHVDNPDHARKLKAEGFFEAASAGFTHVKGYPCECGFNAVFAICGKCGKDNS